MMHLLAIDWASVGVKAGQFVLSFSILVVLHEMGHFLPAKWFGCRVDKFYLFFNPWFSLFKKKVGETEYGLGWVPFGGYVKIAGMVDESMDKEQLKAPPQPYEFRSKPAWQRLIIMLGGVFVNFILALVIFAVILFVWGEERLPMKNLTYGLATDSLATNVGIRDGDMIKAVNSKPLAYYDDLPKDLMLNERPVLTIDRNGKDTVISLPSGFLSQLTQTKLKGFVSPRFPVFVDSVSSDIDYTSNGKLQKGDQIIGLNNQPTVYFNEFERSKQAYKNKPATITVLRNGRDTVQVGVKIKENASVGFFPRSPIKIFETEKREYAFGEAIPAGINYGVERLKEYVTGIGLLFTSKEHKLKDNLGSVLSIGKTFGDSWDWQHFWTMTALFSIILAFMNILPIPALDGGHALFTLYEMVTARKPSDKFMEYAQMVGMVLLMGLMLYAFGLDIWRLMK